MVRYYFLLFTILISVGCVGKSVKSCDLSQINDDVYPVTFTVVDGSSAVSGTTVTLDGYGQQLSDVNGSVVFDQVSPAENIVYTAYKEGYDQVTDSLTVSNEAVTRIIYLNKEAETYTVIFRVTISGTEVEGAKVNFEGYGIKYTDASGLATYTKVSPGYTLPYTVNVTGYSQYVSALNVIDGDITEEVVFALPSYNVRFVINSIDHLLSGAVITLEGYGSRTTDKNGKAQFLNVSQATNIPYTITAQWHDDYSGTVTVADADITVTIYMTGISDDHSADFSIYPNPAIDNMTLDLNCKGTVKLINLDGKVVKKVSVNYEPINLSVTDLPQGIYIVQLITNEVTIEKRVMVK